VLPTSGIEPATNHGADAATSIDITILAIHLLFIVVLPLLTMPVVLIVVTPHGCKVRSYREIVKGVSNPIIDVDDCLLSFGQTHSEARKAYLSTIHLGCREFGKETGGEAGPSRIWFRPDRDLAPDDKGPYIDVLG